MSAMPDALLIIDMQNDFVLPGATACVAGAWITVPRVAETLARFRARSRPVFHVVREYRADGSDIEITRLDGFRAGARIAVPGTPGCAIVEALRPQDGEYRLVKNRFSAFMATELDFMLRRLGIDQLAVCGTQWPNCIRATVFDAVSLGYAVTVIDDATSAQTPAIADANRLDVRNIGVEVVTIATYRPA
jgi:nicotinamidase-related amidase